MKRPSQCIVSQITVSMNDLDELLLQFEHKLKLQSKAVVVCSAKPASLAKKTPDNLLRTICKPYYHQSLSANEPCNQRSIYEKRSARKHPINLGYPDKTKDSRGETIINKPQM